MDREEELHRQQHRKYCEQQILKVGLQKGALYSIISGISVLLSQRYWKFFQTKVATSTKGLLVCGAFSAGFAIGGETTEVECSRSYVPLRRLKTQNQNQVNTQQL